MTMPAPDHSGLLARRDRAFGTGAELFYARPLELVRGEGALLFDEAGNRYVDLYNNVPAIGHGNTRVADAISRQQRTLNTHSRYLSEPIVAYAECLLALHAPGIESVVFSCSGTEANDIAIQMARIATGRQGIVCSDAAYHGNSELVMRLTAVGHWQPESPDVHAFPFPDFYRPAVPGLDPAALAEHYLTGIADAISRCEQSGVGFAGLLACSIFANEGLPDLPADFMARVVDLVHAAGGLMIADEVQSGFGRTGHWWGYQANGFTPDIVVMGKPMGNGVPLSATAASHAVVSGYRGKVDHFNTTAATPLQAAAGMAVLDEIAEHGLVERAGRLGAKLKADLAAAVAGHPCIGEVRGCGLFVVTEVVADRASRAPDPALARRIAERLKDRGFLTASAGAAKNLIKLRPPLVIAAADLAAFLPALAEVLDEVERER